MKILIPMLIQYKLQPHPESEVAPRLGWQEFCEGKRESRGQSHFSPFLAPWHAYLTWFLLIPDSAQPIIVIWVFWAWKCTRSRESTTGCCGSDSTNAWRMSSTTKKVLMEDPNPTNDFSSISSTSGILRTETWTGFDNITLDCFLLQVQVQFNR